MNNKVEIYSTQTCAFCKMAKEYFQKNGVEYTEYDVGNDVARAKEMVDKTHQMGVPVIVINDKVIIGFDRPKIDQLLGIGN